MDSDSKSSFDTCGKATKLSNKLFSSKAEVSNLTLNRGQGGLNLYLEIHLFESSIFVFFCRATFCSSQVLSSITHFLLHRLPLSPALLEGEVIMEFRLCCSCPTAANRGRQTEEGFCVTRCRLERKPSILYQVMQVKGEGTGSWCFMCCMSMNTLEILTNPRETPETS